MKYKPKYLGKCIFNDVQMWIPKSLHKSFYEKKNQKRNYAEGKEGLKICGIAFGHYPCFPYVKCTY